jgi:glycosidase
MLLRNYFAVTISAVLLFSSIACTPKESHIEQTSLIHPEWSYNQTIYELNIRQFSQEGTFRAVEEQLPRLKDLGVGIIWLMPIHPIGELNRKGTLGSYYSVQDYFATNPEYGTKEDFRSLVNAIHSHGMYVIIDWVANHTAWDNPLTASNPDFFELDEDGNFVPPRGTDWSDVIQLDFENRAVWDYMTDALVYWVREFNIDGYRCDVADMVPTEFWSMARQKLDAVKPVFMLAEAETPKHHIAAFDMSYSWRMHHLFNDLANGRESISTLDEYLAEDREMYPKDSFRMQFTSNHDENSWNGTVFERLGDAAKTFAVLASTMEGMPLLYNGQEVGLNKRLEFFEKDPIVWEENEFTEFYTLLFQLRLNNEALFNGVRGGELIRIPSDQNQFVYAFSREMNNDKVIVVLNLSDTSRDVNISSEQLIGSFTELFSKEHVIFQNEIEFSMEPWGYFVFVQD